MIRISVKDEKDEIAIKKMVKELESNNGLCRGCLAAGPNIQTGLCEYCRQWSA